MRWRDIEDGVWWVIPAEVAKNGQGVDLHFSVDGTELRYRHAVRRYSFTYGHDLGSGSSALVSVESPRQKDGRTIVEQRLLDDVPNELAGVCGVDPEYDVKALAKVERIADNETKKLAALAGVLNRHVAVLSTARAELARFIKENFVIDDLLRSQL